jgi:hypothetical protein
LASDYDTNSYEYNTLNDSEEEEEEEEILNAIRDRDLPQMPGKPLENTMPPYKLLTNTSMVYFGSIVPDGWVERAPPSNNDTSDNTHQPFKTSIISLTPLQVATIRGDIKLVRVLFDATKKLKNGKYAN